MTDYIVLITVGVSCFGLGYGLGWWRRRPSRDPVAVPVAAPIEPETVPLHGSKQPQCAQWLREVLRDGPRDPKEIVALGQQAGFSRRTIYYVRQEADFIADTQSPHAPGNQWILVNK